MCDEKYRPANICRWAKPHQDIARLIRSSHKHIVRPFLVLLTKSSTPKSKTSPRLPPFESFLIPVYFDFSIDSPGSLFCPIYDEPYLWSVNRIPAIHTHLQGANGDIWNGKAFLGSHIAFNTEFGYKSVLLACNVAVVSLTPWIRKLWAKNWGEGDQEHPFGPFGERRDAPDFVRRENEVVYGTYKPEDWEKYLNNWHPYWGTLTTDTEKTYLAAMHLWDYLNSPTFKDDVRNSE